MDQRTMLSLDNVAPIGQEFYVQAVVLTLTLSHLTYDWLVQLRSPSFSISKSKFLLLPCQSLEISIKHPQIRHAPLTPFISCRFSPPSNTLNPMHSQAQVVCVPPTVGTQGPSLDFLLKPAPSPKRYRNKRRLLSIHLPPSPPSIIRRRGSRSSYFSRSPRTPLSSFLNFVDTPSTFAKLSPRSTAPSTLSFVLSTPSPVLNSKRHARNFQNLPFILPTSPVIDDNSDTDSASEYDDDIVEPEARSSQDTLVSPSEDLPLEPKKDDQKLAFLHSDPYSSALLSSVCAPLKSTSAPQATRKRSAIVTAAQSPSKLAQSKSLKLKQSIPKFYNSFKSIMATTSSTSSHSSSSSTATRKARKAPEKILPFSTQQIAELDRLMGNPKAAKGKVPSQFAPGTHAPQEDKHYIAPYVPLNGSAPSGTRSFGRDGERHPIGESKGTGAREVGHGTALPYVRDENGVLWSGQEEVDEFQILIAQPEGKRKKAAANIDTRRRGSEEEWKHFSPASASSLDSSRSALRSAASSDIFDLGYDEAVMIPEGGAVGMASTFGGMARATGGVARSTRGVESFPSPEVQYTPGAEQRAKGTDRRRPAAPAISHASSVSSLGTIHPQVPLEKAGKNEFFADAFTPPSTKGRRSPLPPALPLQPVDIDLADLPPPTPRSKLHRHSTSLAVGSANFFANLVGKEGANGPLSPLSPTSPSYLAPLGGPTPYNGLRQSSFSGPTTYKNGTLPSRLGRSMTATPPVVEKQIKKKSSGMGVAHMFRKFAQKA